MAVYSFELHFTAPPGEGVIDAMYEAGWDDATVSLDPVVGGPGVVAFDREAASAVEAVASAIRQARLVGAQVTSWLHEHRLAEVSLTDVESARVCEIADSLVQAKRLQYELRPKERKLLVRAVA